VRPLQYYLLLSCLGAEILAFLYILPVSDRHLRFVHYRLHRTVFALVSSWNWTPKTQVYSRCNMLLLPYLRASWDITLFHIYFRLLAAIFDLPLTVTSQSIVTSPILFLDLKRAGVVFELNCYLSEKPRYAYYRFSGHHLEILNLPLSNHPCLKQINTFLHLHVAISKKLDFAGDGVYKLTTAVFIAEYYLAVTIRTFSEKG